MNTTTGKEQRYESVKSEFLLTHVEYAYNEYGYTVKVIREGDVIEDYTAGNSPFDSQGYVKPQDGLNIQTLGEYARRTAREFAEEFDADAIVENNDWLN